ncbi:MAG: class I SAM-dependent methyltransferase [Rhodobacteraceae bacterium]|nr:class I SAM-dependent methyltransferase [Paracoccaceae bacterium]MBR9821493.1 class I SAM-dependent methyltransferase [Paracoccaceae bacterium]
MSDLPPSPYEAPGFHAEAIAAGRHRAIVGGRWDETGRAQMALLLDHGLRPEHHLLDIGAGSLRLGCKALRYLEPGHYWATDASRALLLAGLAQELDEVPPAQHPPEAQLIGDAAFTFPGVPEVITHAICFAVFPHLTPAHMEVALTNLRRFPALELVAFTVFLAPETEAAAPYRQADGVVTHPGRPPYHRTGAAVEDLCTRLGWRLQRDDRMLPRGQVLFLARRG